MTIEVKEGNKMSFSENAKKAIKIGAMCFLAYLAVYIAKNILGTVTPAMMEAGFAIENIHTVKAVYFYSYAVGQLINGAIGDKIKAKYMMSLGLALSGVSNFAFAQINFNHGAVGEMPLAAYVAYGCTGFFLAMIYGPMTKIVSENTEMPYTTRCSLGYTIASYLGSPAAGIFAAIFAWQTAFSVSSLALIIMAGFVFFFFTLFERKKIIVYGKYKVQKRSSGSKGSIRMLFERQIVKFAVISMITGTIRTTLVTNLSEYFATRLSFTSDAAALAFSIATLGIASSSFLVIFIYERIGYNIDKTLLIMFTSAAVFFILTYFVTAPYVNIVLIVLAIMASSGAATMLWSRYCPSLRDTGMVSGVTGFLDFLSYMAAGTMDLVTPGIVNGAGWSGMMLVCLGFMMIGIVISLPWKKMIRKA